MAAKGLGSDDLSREVREQLAAKRSEKEEVKSVSVALKAMRLELADTKRSVGDFFGQGAAIRGATAGMYSSAIQAGVGQAGGGMVDALSGLTRGLQGLLPVLGAAVGTAAGGPLGAALGGVAGTAGAAAVERFTGPAFHARERAIGEVTSLTAGRAMAGMQLPPEALATMMEGAMIRQRRVADNEAAVRSSANSMAALQAMFGSSR